MCYVSNHPTQRAHTKFFLHTLEYDLFSWTSSIPQDTYKHEYITLPLCKLFYLYYCHFPLILDFIRQFK